MYQIRTIKIIFNMLSCQILLDIARKITDNGVMLIIAYSNVNLYIQPPSDQVKC